MNEIRFERRMIELELGRCHGVVLVVDGEPLRERVRRVEARFDACCAGKYAPICVPDRLTAYFLGEDRAEEGETEGKTELLQCTCGCSGCWPLLARIVATDDTVTWCDFEQPHRNGDLAERWDYAELGSFHFDRGQYLDALVAFARAGAELARTDLDGPGEGWLRRALRRALGPAD